MAGVTASSVQGASSQVNGIHASPAKEDAFHNQLLALRDAIVAGTAPAFASFPGLSEQLKTALAGRYNLGESPERPDLDSLVEATNHSQQTLVRTASASGLPGLQLPTDVAAATKLPYTLDPIFTQESEIVKRTRRKNKRDRTEEDISAHSESLRHSVRDKDMNSDPSLSFEAEVLLLKAHDAHVSGLPPRTAPASATSSFDENDYYSSKAQSEWSSPTSEIRAPVEAFTDDIGSSSVAPFRQKSFVSRDLPSQATSYALGQEPADVLMADDEGDEYVPPDATAFDNSRISGVVMHSADSPDDDSEYEPGELPQGSIALPTIRHTQPAVPSPSVPVIRNHLTHIAAPQPSRVSPLAVAKGSGYELELVNGRPEIVQHHASSSQALDARMSSASPVNGAGGMTRKKARKLERKRKREAEQNSRGRKKRDRHYARPSPSLSPYIKPEPITPPPLVSVPANVPDSSSHPSRPAQLRPAESGIASPVYTPQAQYLQEIPASGLRHEYARPAEPAVVRIASPAAYRPVQRDSQDLRRVASLHYAQRPHSPTYGVSPTAYHHRTVSMPYSDPRLSRGSLPMDVDLPRHYDVSGAEIQHTRRERSRSPPRELALEPYARGRSPVAMPPPPAPARQIFMDQYGNQYYAAEHAPPSVARASMAPVERQTIEVGYERAPSRVSMAYEQPRPQPGRYESVDNRMLPPPPPESYGTRQVGRTRVDDTPTSPVYQASPRYDPRPPPTVPSAREQTSPVYAPRSYSVRPEEAAPTPAPYAPRQASVAPVQHVRREEMGPPPAPATYASRHGSVAPMQYMRHEEPASAAMSYAPRSASVAPVQYVHDLAPASYIPRQASVAPKQYLRPEVPPPARAMSVMPAGYEAVPMQQVRYVDQYGREIDARDARQASVYRYN